MILLVCRCGTALRIAGEHTEVESLFGVHSEWYPQSYPCPACPEKMAFVVNAIPAADQRNLVIHDLTTQEAFAALHGVGLPDEHDCGADAVTSKLLGSRVVSLEVKQIRGSNRSVLHSLFLEDGTRVYLGSGAEGAVVYRIAKRANDALRS